MPEKREENGIKTGRSQVALGTRFIACSVLVALAQVMLWFSQGQWQPLDIGEILRLAGAGAPMWAGPQVTFLVDWLLAVPISAGIAAIGFVIAWIGASNLAAASNPVDQRK